MIGTRITEAEVNRAVGEVNTAHHTDNLVIEHYHPLSGRRCSFTLGVRDSRGPLARRAASGRRMRKACWHAHGEVFDRIIEHNPKARIQTMYSTVTREGGNWQDGQCGSQARPVWMSECCECPGAWLGLIVVYEVRKPQEVSAI